ncbi:MAG: hypothetical protein Kow0092_37250 [Deferrisomatales bacterium]
MGKLFAGAVVGVFAGAALVELLRKGAFGRRFGEEQAEGAVDVEPEAVVEEAVEADGAEYQVT